jgi:hypothetical protein
LDRLGRAQARVDAHSRFQSAKGPKIGSSPILRDADGHIIKPAPSRIRSAILHELGKRQMTRYKLWRTARRSCPTLGQSAVYEFLRGFRQLGLGYIEALLTALDLDVLPRPAAQRRNGRIKPHAGS